MDGLKVPPVGYLSRTLRSCRLWCGIIYAKLVRLGGFSLATPMGFKILESNLTIIIGLHDISWGQKCFCTYAALRTVVRKYLRQNFKMLQYKPYDLYGFVWIHMIYFTISCWNLEPLASSRMDSPSSYPMEVPKKQGLYREPCHGVALIRNSVVSLGRCTR